MNEPASRLHYDFKTIANAASETIFHVRNLEPRTYSLITSGEANPAFWTEVTPHIRYACRERGCRFRVMLGPVVCMDEDSQRNPLVDMVGEPGLELYAAPYRRSWHARLLGLSPYAPNEPTSQTVMLDELYHEALADRRNSRSFRVCDVGALDLINEFIFRFNGTIEDARLKPVTDPFHELLLLPQELIRRFQRLADAEELPYDGLSKADFAEALRESTLTY